MGLNKLGDVGNPTDALPEVLRSMNAEKGKAIFRGEGFDCVSAKGDADEALSEHADIRRQRKMAQGALGVKVDDHATALVAIAIFAGDE